VHDYWHYIVEIGIFDQHCLQIYILSATFLHFEIVNRSLLTDLGLLSGGLHLLREEHVKRWLKRNIVDRIYFDFYN